MANSIWNCGISFLQNKNMRNLFLILLILASFHKRKNYSERLALLIFFCTANMFILVPRDLLKLLEKVNTTLIFYPNDVICNSAMSVVFTPKCPPGELFESK